MTHTLIAHDARRASRSRSRWLAAPLSATLSAIGASLLAAPQVSVAAEMNIAGLPAASVQVGEEYYFLPTVKNADFAQLQFNYINRPSWSKGYRSSGLIMGVPSEPGIYSGIQIGAWDGSQYAVMPPFTITVLPIPGSSEFGVARVSWTEPHVDVDGAPLTNLTGYIVRYGQVENAPSHEIHVASRAATDLTIEHLKAGTWYFEVAAVTSTGASGGFSAPVGDRIP